MLKKNDKTTIIIIEKLKYRNIFILFGFMKLYFAASVEGID